MSKVVEMMEHNYLYGISNITAVCNSSISYIAGFVSRYLKNKLKCTTCTNQLFQEKPDLKETLIAKSKERLTYPSKGVADICIKCENVFRRRVLKTPSFDKMLQPKVPQFVSSVLKMYLG